MCRDTCCTKPFVSHILHTVGYLLNIQQILMFLFNVTKIVIII